MWLLCLAIYFLAGICITVFVFERQDLLNPTFQMCHRKKTFLILTILWPIIGITTICDYFYGND